MARTLLSKYVWVVDTIYRAGRISFRELNRRWLQDEISEGVELAKRTFDNWRYAFQDMFGLVIENEGKGEYRYYILNADDISGNGLRSWLYNTFCVSNALAESQSVKDRILLEYVPSGQGWLKTIIEAMKENRILNITYHGYWKEEESTFDVEPFCVKLFRQRWYMVGRSTYGFYHEQAPRIYSLDRITFLQKTDQSFTMPKDWSAEAFFRGCFGIIVDGEAKEERIKLKVKAGQANYIRDLKLHASQEETEHNKECSVFSYYLRPTFDFMQELLWHGEELEVLEPLWLRKEMAGKIKRMGERYDKE